MLLNDYQEQAAKTAVYSDDYAVIYPVLGLANEAGEVAGKVKKVIRGDYSHMTDDEIGKMLAAELGDVLWYIAATARDLGLTLEDVALNNLAKLHDREMRGAIQGDGDNR